MLAKWVWPMPRPIDHAFSGCVVQPELNLTRRPFGSRNLGKIPWPWSCESAAGTRPCGLVQCLRRESLFLSLELGPKGQVGVIDFSI
jgi:hypothetical protein